MKLITPIGFGILMVALTAFIPSNLSFEESQKLFPRVKQAYERKEELFAMKCRSKQVSEQFSNIFIRVFKKEEQLEVWALDVKGNYVKFGDYKIYAMSGHLGPKREQGDAQVPEGFYTISEFNPVSNYHLSLRINYPNESDMMLSSALKKGGDIYIHGGKVSAGCVAMSDYYIEDIYMCAVKAYAQGQQKIPVHIFPFKMTRINMEYYSAIPQLKQYLPFWRNLADGFMYFERNKVLPDIAVATNGYYTYSDPQRAEAAK